MPCQIDIKYPRHSDTKCCTLTDHTLCAHTRARTHTYTHTQYDEYKSPMDNIGMQDSLLSRFDIIFVVLDEMDPDNDRRISEHVLRMHRYRNPGEQVHYWGDEGWVHCGCLKCHSVNSNWQAAMC